MCGTVEKGGGNGGEKGANGPSTLLKALVTAPEHPPQDIATLNLMCWRSVVGAASEDIIDVVGLLFWC